MCELEIQKLSFDTVKLISSTQIITSVATAIKELFENSVDAGAKVIQVRLENFGLDLIEVKDDGSGVSYDNVQKMFLPGFTSKIRQFEDLDKLQTYGFRGEALAAVCQIAKVSITTKTKQDTLAMLYEIDSSGVPVSSKPSHLNTGTVITISSLFSNLPVRRLFLSSKKKMSEELKKAEYIVQSLSMIHPELAVTLIHNKCPVWRKNSVKGIKQSFMQVAGLKVASKMDHISKSSNKISMDLLVPKKNLENIDNVFTNSNLNMYVYINKRPLICKILSQAVQEHIFNHFSKLDVSFKYAISLISVNVPPNEIDINLEPNKTKVLLRNRIQVVRLIDESLKNYYGHEDFMCGILKEINLEDTAVEEVKEQQSKRPRLEIPKTYESEKFEAKNKDWEVEIIDDDLNRILGMKEPNCVSEPKSLCSQINCENSVLTREEVSEFNNAVNEVSHKLVINKSSCDGERRLIERNDIQARSVEKPILKEWPCRPKIDSPLSLSQFGSNLSETENKKVEEIAAEIEKSAQEWSTEMMKAMKNEKKNQDETDPAGDNIQMFDLSMQSVSSQMGKKELKAFTKFTRIMRPKIIEEFPKIKFTQVAGILVDRWKALTPDEVKYYENLADVVEINRMSHQEAKQMESRKPPEKPSNSRPQNVDLKLIFDRMKKKNKLSRPPRSEIILQVSIGEIKQTKEKPEAQPENVIQIVGQLQPSGSWVYLKGNEIGHVRHQGLQELIAFQKMLSSFCVPKKNIEKPILVNEESLGTVLWNVLIALDSEYEAESSRCVITSDVITKNGFRIEIAKDGEVVCNVRVTEVAESIPHFGILELKEILSMYHKNGDFGGLASWRPTSVYNFITNEAIRLAQQNTSPPDRLEMEDMINTYHLCFRHLPPVCLHSKDIFPAFYNIQEELPKSSG